jgi:hypothetical protein
MMSRAEKFAVYLAIVLASLLAAPVAGIAVFVRWTQLGDGHLFRDLSPALWSARTFLGYFDTYAIASFIPCLIVTSLVGTRLRLSSPEGIHTQLKINSQ